MLWTAATPPSNGAELHEMTYEGFHSVCLVENEIQE